MSSWDPKELCELDDLCTAFIVDPRLGFVTHKMNVNHKSETKETWKRIEKILEEFTLLSTQVQRQYSQTVRRLQEEVPNWWRKFQHKTDDEKNRVQDHLKLYLRMWDPSSGYSIKACDRYSKDGEDGRGGAVVAKKSYQRGDYITDLKGCIARMTPNQQKKILVEGKNDYSVQYSTNTKKSQLWLGPAAFLNHDCKPNSQIVSTGQHTAAVKALCEIGENEEIVIFYGKEFFGIDNSECECRTCERRQQGKFKTEDGKNSGPSPLKTIGKYGLRQTASRKRRAERSEDQKEDQREMPSTRSELELEVNITQERVKGRTERLTKVTSTGLELTLRQSLDNHVNNSRSKQETQEISLKIEDSRINFNLRKK